MNQKEVTELKKRLQKIPAHSRVSAESMWM